MGYTCCLPNRSSTTCLSAYLVFYLVSPHVTTSITPFLPHLAKFISDDCYDFYCLFALLKLTTTTPIHLCTTTCGLYLPFSTPLLYSPFFSVFSPKSLPLLVVRRNKGKRALSPASLLTHHRNPIFLAAMRCFLPFLDYT